jgi:undecaprenyl-diphosphatase
MLVFHAAVLGIVQGLTEFLPVSSSAHLIIIPWLAKWPDPGPVFDVALHMGTLAALLAYFWRDWVNMLKDWRKPMFWLIVLGCIPGAVFGYKFEKYFDTTFHSPLYIGIFMMAMGLLMGAAEKYSKKVDELDVMTWQKALFIGCAQVLALMPGVSRSGITMTAGLFAGFKRESAARFSFLLAMPITAGAGLLKLEHIIHHGLPSGEASSFGIGILLSAIVGFITIKYLLKYLQEHTLNIFVWYRFIVGAVVLGVYFITHSRHF